MKDITYTQDNLFTTFYPNSSQGIEAWNVMAADNDGVAKFLNIHVDNVIWQLKKSGYSVGKDKIVRAISDDELLNALGI